MPRKNLCASSCSFTGGSLKVMVLWLLQGQGHVCSRAGHTGPAGLLLGAPSAAAKSQALIPSQMSYVDRLGRGQETLSSSQATEDWPANKTGPAAGGDWLVLTQACRRVTRHAKLGFPAPALQTLASCKPWVSQKRTLSMARGDTDSINRHLGDVGGPWPPVRPRQCARSSARVLCVWYLKLDNI